MGGFTLVETLIAAVIMFMVLSAATMLYRNAVTASIRAQDRIELTKAAPFVLEEIRYQLRTKGRELESFSGNGRVFEMEYTWRAQVIQRGSPPREIDLSSGEYVEQPIRFKLWSISVSLIQKGYQLDKEFIEVTW